MTPPPSFWTRVRQAKLLRVLAVYFGAAWIVLQVTSLFIDRLGVPEWFMPVTLVLILIGLLVLVATAWVQSHPQTARRAAAEEVPQKWELGLGELREEVGRGHLPHLTWSRAIVGGGIAFLLLFGFGGLYVVIQDRGKTFTPGDAIAEDAAPGIAVLPFSVNGPGLEMWREGVIDLVSTNLDGAAGLRAINSRTVLARWGEQVQGAATPDLETALEAARQTGARYALLGSVVALGRDIRLTADVYDVANGNNLGQAQAQGAPDSVYALVDRLSIAALQVILKDTREALPRVDLAGSTTVSLVALKAFLEGEALFRKSDFDGAIPHYQRAVEVDSTFSLAAYRLSNSYGWAETVSSDLAAQYAEQAARFAGRLPERQATLVRGNQALGRGTLDGIELLRQAVRKYPDDPEAWYYLADTYVHLGDQELVPHDAARQAFERAIALDPRFSPFHIHPIQYAIGEADSTRAVRLLARYKRLAGGTFFERGLQRAVTLAWGGPAERAAVRATLDTLNTQELWFLSRQLLHPRFLPLATDLAVAHRARGDASAGMVRDLVTAQVAQGRLREALATIEDPLLDPAFRGSTLYLLEADGLPVPPEQMTRAVAALAADTSATEGALVLAAVAADAGQWTEYDQALARARVDATRLRAAGDSVGARFTEGVVRAIEGYGAWRRGRRDEALTLLEVARREATGHGPRSGANHLIRRWLGDLLIEMDRPREAVPYLRSLSGWVENPYVVFRLGRLYERLGETQKAREAYETFLLGWRHADYQPWVVEARRAVARLGFAPRG
ncbi:MAG: tetratricopeptide repeat protein [Gemmatimonadota bacterium]